MGSGVHTKPMERAVDLQAVPSWPGAWRLLAVLIGAPVGAVTLPLQEGGAGRRGLPWAGVNCNLLERDSPANYQALGNLKLFR